MQIMGMDMVNFLRSVVTVLAFVTFIGIALWAWSSARRTNFSAAARIPFEDDEQDLEAGWQATPHAERSSK